MTNGQDRLIIFSDGGARGNPGPAAIGIVFYAEDLDHQRKLLDKVKKYLGEHTNNYAEYMALITALEKAQDLGFKSLHCYLDSELVVKQINGQYKVREETLKPLYAKVLKLKANFPSIAFTHVHRKHNAEADKLVNECLDERLADT